jgi:DNA uptake protein ComE-like DNA-binding protein
LGRVPTRRAFATLLVFFVLVFGALLVGMIQTSGYAQAASGREALAKVRARWAARAGLEATLARLEAWREEGSATDAFDALDSMAQVGDGDLLDASWTVRGWAGGREVVGPIDAGMKMNINRVTREQLLSIEPFMSEDVADSILDWLDADSDTRELGAELGYYQGLAYPMYPRNGAMRSIAEMELVAGVDPRDVRGEDWNLNGVLDPNEDDGDASWPPDNADGLLDAAWSGILTTDSVEDSQGPSGEPKLNLAEAEENELRDRLDISPEQAKAIVDYMDATPQATLGDFVRRDLGPLARDAARRRGASRQDQQDAGRTRSLSNAQLGKLLDETTTLPTQILRFVPSRLNINTCDAETLDYLPEIDPELSDAIIAERSSRTNGFASLGDLLEVPGFSREALAGVVELLTVRSTVFVVTSRGVDANTGVEVEVTATLDATTLPATIRGVRVR